MNLENMILLTDHLSHTPEHLIRMEIWLDGQCGCIAGHVVILKEELTGTKRATWSEMAYDPLNMPSTVAQKWLGLDGPTARYIFSGEWQNEPTRFITKKMILEYLNGVIKKEIERRDVKLQTSDFVQEQMMIEKEKEIEDVNSYACV